MIFILLGITFHAQSETYRRGEVLLSKDSITDAPKHEKIAIVKIFHSLDNNKDWIITSKDFKNQKFEIKNKIEYLIEIADVNNDGKITYSELFDAKDLITDEFQTLIASGKTQRNPLNAKWAFFEDYGLAIGLLGMVMLIASFKLI